MEKFKKYKVFSMVSGYKIGVLKIVNCFQNGKKKKNPLGNIIAKQFPSE